MPLESGTEMHGSWFAIPFFTQVPVPGIYLKSVSHLHVCKNVRLSMSRASRRLSGKTLRSMFPNPYAGCATKPLRHNKKSAKLRGSSSDLQNNADLKTLNLSQIYPEPCGMKPSSLSLSRRAAAARSRAAAASRRRG